MLRVSAAHLHGQHAAAEQVIDEVDGVQVTAPVLQPQQLDDVCTRLLVARDRLTQMPVSRVIEAIDQAAQGLLDKGGTERALVLRSLQAISGFSTPMAVHLLDRVAQDWLAPQLELLLREELGGPEAVESFIQRGGGRRCRAIAPPLGFHVFAGNVPGVGTTSIIRALLVRSAVLGKPAAAEPALAAAFARLLSNADPAVGDCVAITYWRGGDVPLEEAVLARAGLVVHYGGAASINALRARAPAHVRFIEHGPRLSFAVIDASSPTALESAGRDLARAVALFDQQGCVSPQIAYVIGNADHARHLARATAATLEEIEKELPRGRISAAEASAIRDLRTRAEFGSFAGRGGDIWTGPDLSYSVILSEDPMFEGTCLNRTLLVKYVPGLPALLDAIAPFRDLLQTAGVAGFAPDRLEAVASSLADAGATRITPIGDMPWPPPVWHHDGRGPLQELVRWTDLEL